MKSALALLISALVVLPANGQSVRYEDSSDWWSFNNGKEDGMHMELLEKGFDRDNFRILGFSLDTVGFDTIAATLGKAKVVDRGDAAYGRSQVCYVSEADSDSQRVYLIFEGGEGGSSTLYLFRGGPGWKGRDLCVRSSVVSADLATGTGLKLGLSRGEVEAVLGRADFSAADRIGYCREFKRRTTQKEFETLRGNDPNVTEKRAHELYDFVPDTMQAEIRFKDGRASYFYVSATQFTD